MKIRKPDYYDRFQCIAGACSDSCCVGWEIDVDEEKREIYRNVDGELGERLKHCIDWEDGHFILQGKEERCPFLNKENLCDLIIGLGEESLCEICREHPRFYEWYDGLTEEGVGLCCEAAARLILEREDKARFVECVVDAQDSAEDLADDVDVIDDADIAQDASKDADAAAETLEILFSARETAFAILQNREKSIWCRLKDFLEYIEELQDGLDFEDLDEIEETVGFYLEAIAEPGIVSPEGPESEQESEPEEESQPQDTIREKNAGYLEILEICGELEPIDDSWPEKLAKIHELLRDPEKFYEAEKAMLEVAADREYEYEHLAVYFVYRYFMKCRTDGDVFSKGCLAVFCVLLIRLLDTVTFMESGKLTKEDRAMNAKDCSKEIEYSEENLAVLAEEFWERGCAGIAACL